MDSHIYDATYEHVMTIVCDKLQSEDKDALNSTASWLDMESQSHIFKGLCRTAQTNWNAMRIVYGFGDPKVLI